ncbi:MULTISPECIES: hypothetical protein [Lacticaseibacillus]|uniref:Uncharacterized protein n=1 Tax=Lacticaseibacillus casei DSM 20011 = JCM 1134 = ATCC 393 TaxID=1423732 RepID=A0AAD1ASD8_LACCA|nr:hypothetical protein [Lacticaseibacillus casei]MBI6597359.1 hypothetical protein [Lacticaseibacillus casei]MBO1481054.1 hypothetical protein [Lacticaseibacillus casei]MBO2416335.1 hypothetical protein [Lacticaseibacillus casei]MCK2080735.1 hypothetical protein [Lacticaseibacillus casei]MDZ5495105.1 hypothetical protein [Lacticaseibacillus casei]
MKKIVNAVPKSGWLAWLGAFAFAILYRYVKTSVPENIGKIILVLIALLVSYAMFATQRQSEQRKLQRFQQGSPSDKRLANEMTDERNQMVIGKAAVIATKLLVYLNIAGLFVLAGLNASSTAMFALAAYTFMIPILNLLIQAHLNRVL